jgi:hypothetical protein
MPAAPARLAVLDKHMPASELAAHGEVAINGSADTTTPLTRMGPPRALSPARQALADHIAHLGLLAANLERLSKPVKWCQAQVQKAQAKLAEAEAALAQIDADHSRRIVEAAKRDSCSAEPLESVEAENRVAHARRNCHSVKMALDEVSQDQIQANANLEAAGARFDQLALAILVEEHEAHLLIWAKARDAYHLAEIDLIGLLAALGQRGRDLEASAPGAGLVWLRQLENMQPPWHHLDHGQVERGGPREVSAASGRWSAVLHALRSDPNATF